MWAALNKQTQIVLAVILPDAPIEVVNDMKKDYDVIQMTLDNSPASIGDIYKNGKFYPQDNKGK